jgi:hypothetical protein
MLLYNYQLLWLKWQDWSSEYGHRRQQSIGAKRAWQGDIDTHAPLIYSVSTFAGRRIQGKAADGWSPTVTGDEAQARMAVVYDTAKRIWALSLSSFNSRGA